MPPPLLLPDPAGPTPDQRRLWAGAQCEPMAPGAVTDPPKMPVDAASPSKPPKMPADAATERIGVSAACSTDRRARDGPRAQQPLAEQRIAPASPDRAGGLSGLREQPRSPASLDSAGSPSHSQHSRSDAPSAQGSTPMRLSRTQRRRMQRKGLEWERLEDLAPTAGTAGLVGVNQGPLASQVDRDALEPMIVGPAGLVEVNQGPFAIPYAAPGAWM